MAACLLLNSYKLQACSHLFWSTRSDSRRTLSNGCSPRSEYWKMDAGNGWRPNGRATVPSMSKNTESQSTTLIDCVTSWFTANSQEKTTSIIKWKMGASDLRAAIRRILNRFLKNSTLLRKLRLARPTSIFIKRIASTATNLRCRTRASINMVDTANSVTQSENRPRAMLSWQLLAGENTTAIQQKCKRIACAATSCLVQTFEPSHTKMVGNIGGVSSAKPLTFRHRLHEGVA